MKRLLFFCYTPFQCFAAVAIKANMFTKERADIVLDDSITQRDVLKEGIGHSRIFERVYYANLRKYFPKNEKKFYKELNRVKASLFPSYLAEEIEFDDKKYDILITTEINYYTESLYMILKKENPDIKVYLMDEGYSSYTYYFREAYRPTARKNKIKRLLFRIPGFIVGRSYLSDDAVKLLLFDPDLLCWDQCPYEIEKIKLSEEWKTRELINEIFMYDEDKKNLVNGEYDGQAVFFEESFFFANSNTNDIRIVDFLGELFGKNNLVIKMHPRSKVDRFSGKGYKVSKSAGLPWELIALNFPDNAEKIFISFSSGAVLNYRFLTGKSYSTILLYKCYKDMYSHVDEMLQQWFEKYAEKYSEALYIPENEQELKDLVMKLRG